MRSVPRLENAVRLASILSSIALILVSFCWPVIIEQKAAEHSSTAQFAMAISASMLLILILIELLYKGLGPRQIAVLAVLIALNAVIRLLGAGVAGIETAFFLVIISAYVFGSTFGFLLGSASLLLSALISGGFGPWLPFQMLAISLIGLAAGLMPKVRRPRLVLSLFSVPASFTYGALMTMWNWPYLAGAGSSVSYAAGAGLVENLTRFVRFEIVTGGLIWDLGRAVTTVILIAVTGTTLLATLNRAAGRAAVVKLTKV